MVGKIYPSEKRTYIDPISGHRVTQLTSQGINCHMYFTDNSFDLGGHEIYFVSDRGNESGHFNIFRMNLDSGEMIQLTDEPYGVVFNAFTKTPDSELLVYKSGNSVHLLNTRTMENKIIYTDNEMVFAQMHISPDKKTLGMTRNENVGQTGDAGANYDGFYEKFVWVKDGRVTLMDINGGNVRDVFCDTHLLGHFQFAPDDSRICMFCHEGPWNYVNQRIWILNTETGKAIPCFRQGPEDCVGHEFWTRDGNIVFDNRRAGHDGTISSDKTQVVVKAVDNGQIPYFGFADKTGHVFRTVDMPFYCNHYHANNDNTVFVGDAVEDLLLIRPEEKGDRQLTVLARHNTTWKYHWAHCHPTFSWEGDQILYAAATDDTHGNLFLIDDISWALNG